MKRFIAFCDSLCPIRKCARGRGYETCGACCEMESCPKLAMITANNRQALSNLKGEL
ncbi:MAG: hypothetical protein J5869_02485 [Bacteroidaceae bacterium]|nr:hypothetical protein [Bacteroidaceae bacterium]